MNQRRLIILAIVFSFLTAGSVMAQSPQREAAEPKGNASTAPEEYTSLVKDVFAPITDKLKLTHEQQFQIIAIIVETEVNAAPWAQSLQQLEQQLNEIAYDERPNEDKLRELSDRQAALLSDLIQMKTRAKWNIYRLLTPEQRVLVAREFRPKTQLEGHLGSISVY